MLELYIAGGYLALIIYSLLLDNNGFRDYVEALAASIIKLNKIKNTHPYSLIQMFGIILLIISWPGIIIIGLLLLDYFMNHGRK